MNEHKPIAAQDSNIGGNLSITAQETKRGGYSSWFNWRRSGGEEKQLLPNNSSKDMDASKESTEGLNAVATQTSRSSSPESKETNNQINATIASAGVNVELTDLNKSLNISDEIRSEMYKKSLRLTTEQIECLNLKNGMNEISFSVTTAYQGTSRCKCYLFRWKYNDRVVISDIDGTITKSDVLGHILPMVGRDWAQIGVAELFSKIEANGYKLLYLSARAIGQSKVS